MDRSYEYEDDYIPDDYEPEEERGYEYDPAEERGYEYINEYPQGVKCQDGLILPLWQGTDELSHGDRVGRGVLYFFILLYLFLGVAILLNKLMESMETITSLMKRVSLPDPESGKTQIIIAKIWNQTLANIFMVVGSSSPLILIAIIDVWGNGVYAGDIGPFTILGSSAFNLFVTIGVSAAAVPIVKGGKVTNIWSFVLIAFGSMAILLWVYLSVGFISYGAIETWEGVFTLILYIIIIICTVLVGKLPKDQTSNDEYKSNFQHYKLIMVKMGFDNPNIEEYELLKKVSECGACRKPNSWAFYVMQATNKIAGRCKQQNLETLKMEVAKTATVYDKKEETITLVMTPVSESDELKSKIDNILMGANNGGGMILSLWTQQFQYLVQAESFGGPTVINWIIHTVTFPWKVISSIIPPSAILGGYLTFIMTSFLILILSTLIVDINSSLGCFINCKESILAFVFISIGLNIPTLLSAKHAAMEEETADLPLFCLLAGNLSASSLGLGIPWLLCSIYWEAQGTQFIVPVGDLGFCLTNLFVFGLTTIIVLFVRRCCAGGELGGNKVCKIITFIVFLLFWLYSVIMFTAEAYGFIQPGF